MKKGIIFVSAFIFFAASPAFPISSEIETGRSYLNSTQNQSGSWGDTVTASNTEYFSTLAVLDSFKQLGINDTPQYQTGIQWIQNQTTENTAYIANRIYILANSGIDFTTDINTLLSYRNGDGGWGIYLNYKSNNFHTIQALQALTANYSDQNVISSAIAYLTSTQNTDGGWGFCAAASAGCSDGESNVYMTALVLNTLSQFKTTYALSTPINSAVVYLLAKQKIDGGFGSSTDSESPSTVFETALTFEALITSGAVGAEYAENMQNALNYLTSAQLSNGSWEDDPYSTALALRVLYLYSNPPPPPPTAGTITGKVRDASTNQLLAGVSAALQSDPTKTTLTDASGSFSLTNVPAGSQTIDFFLNGYGTASVTVNVTTGSIIDIGTISLSANPTTGIIKGTVTDAANEQPLSGVTITVAGSFNGTATTGADGSFIFANVTPGAVTLSATKTGYNSVTGTGTVTAGGVLFFNPQMTAASPQSTTGTVTGKVIDSSTGQPVAGVFVELLSNGSVVRTDATGNFTLSNVPSGSQTIFFALAGYTDVAITVNITAGAINDLGTITLAPNPTTGVIRGTATDASSKQPLQGVIITLSGSFTGTATTDSSGNFVFTNVTPGTVTITASKTGYNTMTGTAVVVACEILYVNPEMTPTATPLSNLKAGGITVSNPAPTQGETVTISAVIHNLGFSQTPEASARFYDGDPNNGGIQIGADQPVLSLAPNGSTTIQVTYDTSGKTGRHDIFVLVDFANAIKELDESDNQASNTVTILNPVDLTVNGKEILYSPLDPTPDSTFIIMAPIRNLGEKPLENVTVALYDGDPGSGGVKLSEKTIPLVIPLLGEPVSFELRGQNLGAHIYYISVDPYNQVIEFDKTNNTGTVSIEIKDPNSLSSTTDLYITKSDISFNPTFPAEGQNVTIKAVLHNRSSLYLRYVDVSFYNGDPKQGGVFLGTVNAYVPDWGQWTASFNWKMTEGAPVVYVVIDKDGKIRESDKTNNIAFKPINTYAADLSVTERDIALDPLLPEKGQPVTLNVTVNNVGNVGSSGTLSVYEVDPKGKRALIGITDVSVNGSGKNTVSVGGWTYPDRSGTIVAVVDNINPGDSDPLNNEITVTYGESIGPGSNNEGKEFWIAWPENYPGYYTSSQIVVQSRVSAQVTIAGPWLYWSGMVSPGAPLVIPYLIWEAPITSNGVVEDKGIHITSDADITVIFKTPSYAATVDDAYLAIPVKNLGTEYFDISYEPNYNSSWSFSRITVVASKDNTKVSIGDIVVNLNRGQTYQIKSNTVDYTGTRIRSDKTITVITGVTCVFIPNNCPACDTLLEQLLPVSLWGTDYFTAPLYSPWSGDYIRMLAAEDDTAVTISTVIPQTITLNKGQWTQLDTDFATHIRATKPIEVAQFRKGQDCAGGGDPFEVLMMPTDKFRTFYRFYVMPGYDPGNYQYGNFATIIAPEPETKIILDGSVFTPAWQPLPDNGNYTMASLMAGEHVITADKPVAIYVHGYRWYGSYAYPAGFGIPLPDLEIQNLSLAPQNPSEGQLVKINATLSNIGDLAQNVLVRAYNGDPIADGTPLVDVYVDILYTGESTPVEFVWDTYGYSGVNNIYVVADPLDITGESDENNNAAMVTVDDRG